MTNQDLIVTLREAGLVGAGGAGFPTYVKLQSKAEYVVVNGAECEPLLRVDQQLMEQYAQEILTALEQVATIVEAKKCYIALKKKYHGAIDRLSALLPAYAGKIELFLLDDFYPAGDEQVTVYEVLGRIVPEGGIPLNISCVVMNPETLLNVYRATQGTPVYTKFVTVTGAVANPATFSVPVGVSVKEILALAGGVTCGPFKVIDGGPMMGKTIDPETAVVTKTTKGLIVLPENHSLIQSKEKPMAAMLRDAKIACCQCSLCTEVCPRNLLGHRLHPDKLMRIAAYGGVMEGNVNAQEAFLCSECGLCQQGCVMGLQPWKLNKLLKQSFAKAGVKNPMNQKPEAVHPFREYKKFPMARLVARLGLSDVNVPAPLTACGQNFTTAKVSLSSHIGAPAEPCVSVGDMVQAGQCIGKVPEGKLGAYVHASMDGKIKAIANGFVTIEAVQTTAGGEIV